MRHVNNVLDRKWGSTRSEMRLFDGYSTITTNTKYKCLYTIGYAIHMFVISLYVCILCRVIFNELSYIIHMFVLHWLCYSNVCYIIICLCFMSCHFKWVMLYHSYVCTLFLMWNTSYVLYDAYICKAYSISFIRHVVSFICLYTTFVCVCVFVCVWVCAHLKNRSGWTRSMEMPAARTHG